MLVKRIWMDTLEKDFDPTTDGVDVMDEMINGEVWTAQFVTLPYLKQQMQMSVVAVADSEGIPAIKTGFVALETPHVIVERLDRDTIEDVVDDLLALETFESVFDLVTDLPESSLVEE
jgi:hypothetical protein